jgi:sugar phosphate isomerase/epimerase
VDEAAAIGAPLVVLVCGAEPAQPLFDSRAQIEEGIQAVLPHAEAAGVKLAIEPLHPMYADTRSAINTLEQANDMCERIGSEWVTVAVDVYHLWWDPALEQEISRSGRLGTLGAFHVCDWRVPTRDFLMDREIPGRGCIDVPGIRRWVEETGFTGFIEVEIFSTEHWEREQKEYLTEIIEAYDTAV